MRSTRQSSEAITRAAWLSGTWSEFCLRRTQHSHFSLIRHDKAARPGLCIGIRKPPRNVVGDAPLLCIWKTHEQDAEVTAWCELARIGQVEILSNQETPFSLHRCPH